MKRNRSPSPLPIVIEPELDAFQLCSDLYAVLAQSWIHTLDCPQWPSFGRGRALWKLRQVNHAGYNAVRNAVGSVLVPRQQALRSALDAWLAAASPDDRPTTFFPFPTAPGLRGPLPLVWVHRCKGGRREGARPPGASLDECKWYRPLFAWAVACSGTLYPRAPLVDMPAAVALFVADKGAASCDTVGRYFAGSLKEHLADYFRPRWESTRVSEHHPLGVVVTLPLTRLYGIAQHETFIGLLLRQVPPREAAVFLLLWAQHCTLETGVVDETMLMNIIYPLLVRAVLPDYDFPRGLASPEWEIAHLWLQDAPDSLIIMPGYANPRIKDDAYAMDEWAERVDSGRSSLCSLVKKKSQ